MKKLLALIAFLPFTCSAFSVGVVSDIHTGKMNTRRSGPSIVYPSKAVSYFERAVKEMKSKGVDVIISLGDSTQAGGSKYYKQLKKIEKKYGVKTIWVWGNHSHSGDKLLGPANQVYEKDGFTFITLDTSACPKKQINGGCLDQSQVDFLHQNYVEGAIVLQHIPPLVKNTCNLRTDFIAEENMITWSGHFHKEMTCGNARVFPALTEHKKLTYRIINL